MTHQQKELDSECTGAYEDQFGVTRLPKFFVSAICRTLATQLLGPKIGMQHVREIFGTTVHSNLSIIVAMML
jgi:hypothetical protein